MQGTEHTKISPSPVFTATGIQWRSRTGCGRRYIDPLQCSRRFSDRPHGLSI